MRKRIILYGGLGNQMFQYSLFLYLKSIHGQEILLDQTFINKFKIHNGFVLPKIININLNYVVENRKFVFLYRIILYLLRKTKKVVTDRNLEDDIDNFEKGIIRLIKTRPIVYFGYFQSYQIVERVKEELFKNLNLNDSILNEYRERINNCQSISIHVRRGDYFSNKLERIYGNICNDLYYKKAISVIKNRVENPFYFVFTDDLEWVKHNMTNILGLNYEIVSNNYTNVDYIELSYMSLCKHNIISNSTFSWWGAYLNLNTDKIVIAPSKWTNIENRSKNILPPNWITINSEK